MVKRKNGSCKHMSAAHAVQATSAWSQERHIEHVELLHQISTAAGTPGPLRVLKQLLYFWNLPKSQLPSFWTGLHAVFQGNEPCSPERFRPFTLVEAAEVLLEFEPRVS